MMLAKTRQQRRYAHLPLTVLAAVFGKLVLLALYEAFLMLLGSLRVGRKLLDVIAPQPLHLFQAKMMVMLVRRSDIRGCLRKGRLLLHEHISQNVTDSKIPRVAVGAMHTKGQRIRSRLRTRSNPIAESVGHVLGSQDASQEVFVFVDLELFFEGVAYTCLWPL
jgi:hypothetical protein